MGTLATAEPLTMEYSRWTVRDEIANSTLFRKINAIITAFWGGINLLQSITILVGIAFPSWSLFWIIATYIMLIPAFWFTAWFPRWYLSRVTRGSMGVVAC